MTLIQEKDVHYFGKDYKIILCTENNDRTKLYAGCFQKTLGGILYKPAYANGQGDSDQQFGMILNYVDDASKTNFVVVYGYNQSKAAGSYIVKNATTGQQMITDISNAEYYLDTYTNIVHGHISFLDQQGRTIPQ